jgi:NADH-quinone oxidoreductase subunit J
LNDLLVPLFVACAVALVSGLLVVTARRPVRAVVALLAHSLSIAALYLLLAADLVALAQVLIYSGAIVVLFLFVIALLPTGGVETGSGASQALGAVLAGGALIAALAAWFVAGPPLPAAPAVAAGGVDEIGRALFRRLIVAFELTGPLLVVAIVGAVAIWRRQEREPAHGEARRGGVR